jgi:pimeloyl-ACP methyl ester carboxylesterase
MTRKKTIIILHGWGGSPKTWQKVAEELRKKNYQVEIPYLPGFDKNNPLGKPYILEDYSQWLFQFINQKKINKVMIVGHSNGGRIAAYFAAKHPDGVEKLILIGAAGIPPKNKIKTTVFKLASQLGKSFFKVVGNKKLFNLGQKILYKLAGESDYLNASPIMKKTMINILSSDLTNTFAKIQCPTLIVWGRNDKYTPLWMGKKIHQLIKNSQLIVINDAHHGIHLTHLAKLIELIVKFIEK